VFGQLVADGVGGVERRHGLLEDHRHLAAAQRVDAARAGGRQILAQHGQAPRAFGRTSGNGVPRNALLLSIFALLLGVLLNYLVPEKVFVWVTSIATFGAIWTWAMILLAQMKFRRSLSPAEQGKLQFKMWLFPISSYLALAFLVLVVALMAFFEDTRIALYIGPAFLVLLTVLFKVFKLGNQPDAHLTSNTAS